MVTDPNERMKVISTTPRSYGDDGTKTLLYEHVSKKKNLGTLLNVRAAENAGADVQWVSSITAVAHCQNKKVLFNGYICNQSQVGAKIVEDKFLLKYFLAKAEVPTARGSLAKSADEAIQFQRSYESPIVVKPTSAYGGKGVTVNVSIEQEISAAFDRAKRVGSGEVLVEEYIPGDAEFRCLATDTECVSVVQRLLPHVFGDGKSTIRELIAQKNAQRKMVPSVVNRYIPIDELTGAYLSKHGLSLDTVLEQGINQVVRDVGGLSSGGEPYECFEHVPQSLKDAAVKAVAAVPGLTWGGVDILISSDSGQPFVVEINSSADIAGSMYPLYGTPKDAAGRMWSLRLAGVREDSSHISKHVGADEAPTGGPAAEIRIPQAGEHHEEVSLAHAIRAVLRRRGYSVTRASAGVLSVVDDDGTQMWFTEDFMGLRDLATVKRVMRRAGTVRRLLSGSNVPRPAGVRFRDLSGLFDFIGAKGFPVRVFPEQRAWASRHTATLDSREDLEEFSMGDFSSWMAQSVVPGPRLTVFATRDRELWTTTRDSSIEPSSDQLAAASESAIRAVRSVPELRWAAVDLVIRDDRASKGRPSKVLVEGMTLTPRIQQRSFSLSGSMENVLDKIIRDL